MPAELRRTQRKGHVAADSRRPTPEAATTGRWLPSSLSLWISSSLGPGGEPVRPQRSSFLDSRRGQGIAPGAAQIKSRWLLQGQKPPGRATSKGGPNRGNGAGVAGLSQATAGGARAPPTASSSVAAAGDPSATASIAAGACLLASFQAGSLLSCPRRLLKLPHSRARIAQPRLGSKRRIEQHRPLRRQAHRVRRARLLPVGPRRWPQGRCKTRPPSAQRRPPCLRRPWPPARAGVLLENAPRASSRLSGSIRALR